MSNETILLMNELLENVILENNKLIILYQDKKDYSKVGNHVNLKYELEGIIKKLKKGEGLK